MLLYYSKDSFKDIRYVKSAQDDKEAVKNREARCCLGDMIIKKRLYKTLKVEVSTNEVSGWDHKLSYKNNKGIFST